MRLLDVRTLELKSFVNEIPPYCILSHCWEDDEVMFSDLVDVEEAKKKRGFKKIEKTCEQALQDQIDYAWIDTCCIDKSSSAELSEAINSMFSWYKESEKCYAYLADVKSRAGLSQSKWFTRSWTLQELLAPSCFQTELRTGMEFFSDDWQCLGSKGGLSNTISSITGIGQDYLEGRSLHSASISMRMSWAADRRATRSEDIAYSLLGLFDVNMPLLYGEGQLKAFRRLQEEIMKVSEDETLFAWDSTEFTGSASPSDVLASDPKDFVEAKFLIPFASNDRIIPYAMTHRGLRISLQLFPTDLRNTIRPLRSPVMIWFSTENNLVWAVLRCHVAHDFNNFVVIPLQHLASDIYQRDTSTSVSLLPIEYSSPLSFIEEVYIRNSRIASISNSIRRRFGFLIRTLPTDFIIASALPENAWQSKDRILQAETNDSGPRSWHASLNISAYLTLPKDKPPINCMIFLGLGCRKEQEGKPPKPWCHLDDKIYKPGSGDLELFHGMVSTRPPRHDVDGFSISSNVRRDIRLKVNIAPKIVLGQDMFVVDIEFVKDDISLGVPIREIQGAGNIDGPSLTGSN